MVITSKQFTRHRSFNLQITLWSTYYYHNIYTTEEPKAHREHNMVITAQSLEDLKCFTPGLVTMPRNISQVPTFRMLYSYIQELMLWRGCDRLHVGLGRTTVATTWAFSGQWWQEWHWCHLGLGLACLVYYSLKQSSGAAKIYFQAEIVAVARACVTASLSPCGSFRKNDFFSVSLSLCFCHSLICICVSFFFFVFLF